MALFRQPVYSLTFPGLSDNSFSWIINDELTAFFLSQISLRPRTTFWPQPDPEWQETFVDPGVFPNFAIATSEHNIVEDNPPSYEYYEGAFYCANPLKLVGYTGPDCDGVQPFAGSFAINGTYYGSYKYDRGNDYSPNMYQYMIFEDPENPGDYSVLNNISQHPLGIFPYLSVPSWRWWDHGEYPPVPHDELTYDSVFLIYEYDTDDPSDASEWGLYVCRTYSNINSSTGAYDMNVSVTYVSRQGLSENQRVNFDILWTAIFTLPPTPPEEESNPYTHDSSSGSTQIGGTDVGDTETEFGESNVTTPSLTGANCDFFTAYKINEGALAGIAKGLWDPDFWDTLKEKYRTPGEAIVALYMLPLSSSNDTTSEWHWYNLPADAELIALGGTTITAPSEGGSAPKGQRVTKRYVKFPFGEATIKSRWDTYPNYNRYTKAKIQLPFCGEFDLDMNELLQQYENVSYDDGALKRVEVKTGENKTGSTVRLEYIVDVLTGACVACLYINNALKYQFSGQMQSTLPWSYASRESGLSTLTGLIGGAVAVGVGIVTGGIGLAVGGAATIGMSGVKGSLERQSKQGHTNGGFGSLLGAMQSKYPKITITYPNIKPGETQGSFVGGASPYTTTIGAKLGFLKVTAVHLDNVPATDAEKAEIEQLLKSGIVIHQYEEG